jgi:hypothetical protein
MNCSAVRDHLPLYVYGDLPEDVSDLVRQHLIGCAACRREHAGLLEVRQLLDATPAPAVSVDIAGVYQHAAEQAASRQRRWRRIAVAGWGAVAAVLLVALFCRFEVHVEGHQLTLRWGNPPAAPVPPSPAVVTIDPESLRLLQELTQALATEVEMCDARQQVALARLREELHFVQQQFESRWAAAAEDVAALYTAHFRPKGTMP